MSKAAETVEDPTPKEEAQAGSEAAKYRRQLRDTEAERDALKEQVTALRKTIADTALGEILEQPDGFWATGATLETFFSEDGVLDHEALKAAAGEASASLGLAQAGLAFEREAGLGVKGSSPEEGVTWQKVISPN